LSKTALLTTDRKQAREISGDPADDTHSLGLSIHADAVTATSPICDDEREGC